MGVSARIIVFYLTPHVEYVQHVSTCQMSLYFSHVVGLTTEPVFHSVSMHSRSTSVLQGDDLDVCFRVALRIKATS